MNPPPTPRIIYFRHLPPPTPQVDHEKNSDPPPNTPLTPKCSRLPNLITNDSSLNIPRVQIYIKISESVLYTFRVIPVCIPVLSIDQWPSTAYTMVNSIIFITIQELILLSVLCLSMATSTWSVNNTGNWYYPTLVTESGNFCRARSQFRPLSAHGIRISVYITLNTNKFGYGNLPQSFENLLYAYNPLTD